MRTFLIIWLFVTLNIVALAQSISTNKKVVLSKDRNSELSIGDIAGSKDVVLIFATDDCPYNDRYKDRLESLIADFQDVKSGGETANSLYNLSGSEFVWDNENALKKLLGARKSPEVFLMKNLSSSFRLIYSGSIDDDPQSSADVSNAYLRDALALLRKSEEPERKKTIPTGCILR